MVRKLCQRTGEKRQKPQQRIWEAAVNRDWDTVKELLQCDPSLITVTGNDDEYEISLLHLAIGKEADLKLVEYLVSLGADINAQFNVREPDIDNNGKVRGYYTYPTPPSLHFAVIQDDSNIDILQYLVLQGSDINATANSGLTPLHCAAMYSYRMKTLEYLISVGADIHARDECGNTPLHYAAQWSFNDDILKYLIAQGADRNAINNDGMTPLDIANTEEKRYILRDAMVQR